VRRVANKDFEARPDFSVDEIVAVEYNGHYYSAKVKKILHDEGGVQVGREVRISGGNFYLLDANSNSNGITLKQYKSFCFCFLV